MSMWGVLRSFLLNRTSKTTTVYLSNKAFQIEIDAKNQKPKKPLNVFFRFWLNNRNKIIERQPGVGVKDVIRIAKKMWIEVPEGEKTKLYAEYEKDLEDYKAEMKKYKQLKSLESIYDSNTIKKFKLKSKSNDLDDFVLPKPKRPPSAFLLFFKEKLSDMDSSEPYQQKMLLIKDKWDALPNAEKQKYQSQFHKEYEQYQIRLAQWKKSLTDIDIDENKKNF